MNAVVKAPREPFNPNDGGAEMGGFPVFDQALDIDTYANFFLSIGPTSMERWVNDLARQIDTDKSQAKLALDGGTPTSKAIQKSPNLPPDMQSFARFSLMPETYNGGVVQWPGIPPEALRKIVRENLAPQTIIAQRVDDVLKYANQSTHPWKPGWQIKLRQGFEVPKDQEKKDIQDAIKFLHNCTVTTDKPRERDAAGLQDFAAYLAMITRDSLTFDGMAVWTDMDLSGRVRTFKPLSSFNIRLCLPSGYQGDKNIYAVAVDDAGNVIHTFTRDQLTFLRRNPRPDADIWGYGYPEIEQAVRLIQAFQNAMDMNADVFTRNSMPNGFLVAKGSMMNQKQLDTLSRIWINLRRGITKQWALPVIPVPKDGDIEIKDLSHLKDMDAYYVDFMNMVAGLFCALYRFPVARLGYHISGKANDNKPETPTTTAPGIDDYDPYIAVLLGHHERLINQYILWSRWPHLQFQFTGKSPKEDAREYEARVLACTQDERRALSDQEPMEKLGTDEETKKLGKILGIAPVDPALAGVYQSALQAVLGKPGEGEDGGTPGARMTSKKDPARSEDHGHASGVRRDSAAESKKSDIELIMESQINTATQVNDLVKAVQVLASAMETLLPKT